MRNFLLTVCALLAFSAAGAELRFDFGDAATGVVSTNFSPVLLGGGGPPAWKILMDEVPSAFAPLTDKAQNVASRAVLAQTSRDATDERFPILIYNREVFRDFNFSTRFKIVAGTTEQMAGVVFRFQNASNFYVVRASALGKNLRFYKVVNGVRTDPIGPSVDFSTNAWHTLAVKCEGNQILISLDDRPALPTLGDNSFTEGKLGFWTKSDAGSYFTDSTVNYTPRVPVAQSMVDSVLEKQTRLLGLRVYVLDGNTTRIIASKETAEIGRAGTDAELQAIREGTVFYGRETDAALVTLPLHDRNGENIAAVRVKLKSFFGETQNNAVTRATTILKKMEALVTSADDLRK